MWCNGLDLEEWLEDVATEDEQFALHGNCHQWVKEHFQEGDEILIITALDDDYDFDHIVHCFLYRDDMFIDVRGQTPCFEDVMEGFDDYYEDWSGEYNCYNLKEFKKILLKLGVILK